MLFRRELCKLRRLAEHHASQAQLGELRLPHHRGVAKMERIDASYSESFVHAIERDVCRGAQQIEATVVGGEEGFNTGVLRTRA